MNVHKIGIHNTPVSLLKLPPKENKMPLLLHCASSALPMSLFLLSLLFLLGYAPVSGCVIGLCPIISDNEDGFCLFDWIATERESSQLSCLVSAKLAAALSESQPPALSVLPYSPDHVFSVQFYCSVLALPMSLCLLSVSFRLPFCLDMRRSLAPRLVCVP